MSFLLLILFLIWISPIIGVLGFCAVVFGYKEEKFVKTSAPAIKGNHLDSNTLGRGGQMNTNMLPIQKDQEVFFDFKILSSTEELSGITKYSLN